MTKIFVGALISLGFLVPTFAFAHSSHSSHNKPSRDRTPPAITAIHIGSSNADPAKAKVGDTVTLTFTTSEKIKTPVVLVETKTVFVKARNTSGNSWEASYVVNAKDRTGRVDYLLAIADTSKNVYICSSARIPHVKYCPTTDGSSVTIYKDTTPPPPTDAEAPVIEAHADVYATTQGTEATVSYAAPAAVDNVDGSVAVSCTPASGTSFALGTTTVTCSASDAAGNSAASTFAVVVTQDVVVPADTEAPVIEAHADVYATTQGTEATVSYAAPAAVDNVDGSVAVSCTPASGTSFALGTTTVTCSASDAAGNSAASTFDIIVEQEVVAPQLYTMDSQPIESDLCGENTGTWLVCDIPTTFSFTDGTGAGIKTIDLGVGSNMDTGILQSVTIAGQIDFNTPWDITISCYTDSSHTSVCPDWAAITDDANESSDSKYWTADFSSLNRTFKQDGYYLMTIDDTGWDAPVYGSAAAQEPYWEIVGLQ